MTIACTCLESGLFKICGPDFNGGLYCAAENINRNVSGQSTKLVTKSDQPDSIASM